MTITRTPESVAAARPLCNAAAGLPQDRAAIAAMMAESFINGMNTQARLNSAPAEQPEKKSATQ